MKPARSKPRFEDIGWEVWVSLFATHAGGFLPRFSLWFLIAIIPFGIFYLIAKEEGVSRDIVSNVSLLYLIVVGLLVASRAWNAALARVLRGGNVYDDYTLVLAKENELLEVQPHINTMKEFSRAHFSRVMSIWLPLNAACYLYFDKPKYYYTALYFSKSSNEGTQILVGFLLLFIGFLIWIGALYFLVGRTFNGYQLMLLPVAPEKKSAQSLRQGPIGKEAPPADLDQE